ncbi:uncharacterized protein V6R79_001858 [Siganus canaliculatus]
MSLWGFGFREMENRSRRSCVKEPEQDVMWMSSGRRRGPGHGGRTQSAKRWLLLKIELISIWKRTVKVTTGRRAGEAPDAGTRLENGELKAEDPVGERHMEELKGENERRRDQPLLREMKQGKLALEQRVRARANWRKLQRAGGAGVQADCSFNH